MKIHSSFDKGCCEPQHHDKSRIPILTRNGILCFDKKNVTDLAESKGDHKPEFPLWDHKPQRCEKALPEVLSLLLPPLPAKFSCPLYQPVWRPAGRRCVPAARWPFPPVAISARRPFTPNGCSRLLAASPRPTALRLAATFA